ncbi:MAG TPA: hypothetical protein VNG91_01765 [Terriglobia bacterium]|nr:hypothetical protein [Terriglobia bacterium]
MADVTEQTQRRLRLGPWLAGPFAFISLLIVARFVLEIFGVSHLLTRYLSSTGAVFLVAIYLGAVAPLRGVQKSWQIVLPGVLLAAWTQGWVVLLTVISGALRLQSSHFAEPQDWGNWGHMGRHVLAHLAEIVPASIVILVLMAAMLVLWHWPVTVGPGALLGALVVIRFWSEAMDLSPVVSSAWSSSVAFLLCGFFLGGVGSRMGLSSPRRLFMPAMVMGWTWRFWIFVAVLMSAAAPYYKTHFYSHAQGHVLFHLLAFFGIEGVVVGFVAGLIEWGIASWTAGALRSRNPE